MNLRTKLLLAFLSATLIPVAALGFLSFREARDALEQEALDGLILAAEAKEGHVYGFLEAIKGRALDFSSDGFIHDSLEAMRKLDLRDPQYEKFRSALSEHLMRNKLPLDKSVHVIAVIDLKGHIIAATEEGDIGRDESRDDYFVQGRKGLYASDIHASHHGVMSMHHIAASAPLTGRVTGALLGVIVNFYDTRDLDKILSGAFQLEQGAPSGVMGRRETLDIYLVNRERRLVTPSRSGGEVMRQGVDTLPVLECAVGREFAGLYENFLGREVLGASMCFPGTGWTLLAEIDAVEAFAPAAALGKHIVALGLSVMILALLLASIVSLGVTRPVVALSRITQRFAEGDYTARARVRSRDEIGDLAEALNTMAETINEKAREMAVLQEAVLEIGSQLEIEPLLEKLAWHAAILVRVELAALVVLHPETGAIQFFKTNIPPDRFPVKRMPEGRGLLGVVLKEGVPLRVDDVVKDPRFGGLPEGHPSVRNLLGVPLILEDKVVGELLVANKEGGTAFTRDDEDLLRILAYQSAAALENARLHTKTMELATTDALTGLTNRRVFDGRLCAEVDRAGRYQHPLSVLMLDIDHFKRVNDTYGHPAGDAVLQGLAGLLVKQVRTVDLAARHGGEEFVVLLPETDGGRAKGVGERIRKAVAGTPFLLPDGKEIPVTVSIGVACYPACGGSAPELFERADQALYIAKQAGRNRVCLYRETLKAQLEKEPERMTEMLNESLENVQPIVTAVDVKTAFARDHAEKVEKYAVLLGKALGFSKEEIQTLHYAGLLHDVGIVVIPDAVLNKTGALTPEEWAMVREHPVTGARLVGQVPSLQGVVSPVRHHHERYDGSGYPDGLKGEAIPFLARVLAVADAYSAMTSDRPHRKALTPEDVTRQIAQGAGTLFDPAIVKVFVEKVFARP